jgi:hypothetical protein
MARQPFSDPGMLASGIIVEDRMDGVSGGNLAFDRIEEANELLVAMALCVSPDHGSFKDVHGRE